MFETKYSMSYDCHQFGQSHNYYRSKRQLFHLEISTDMDFSFLLKVILTFAYLSTYSLEVVCHLKLVLLVGHVTLHLRVGVVDDGQEHVDQHEEYEEHKEHEEDRTQDTVGCLKLVEVKVSQYDTKQCEARTDVNIQLNIRYEFDETDLQ